MKKIFRILALISFISVYSACSLIQNSRLQKVEFDQQEIGNKNYSDWLVIVYADGDNSLESAIWYDLNEMEYGLSLIRDDDGYTKSGFSSVRVLILWDGKNSYEENGAASIYELGADKKRNTTLSSNTINYSKSATDWICQQVSELDSNGNGEVKMNSKETLTAFLNWVNQYYTSKYSIMVFEDHGTGPGEYYSRAICQDNSDSGSMMSSGEMGQGLKEAGYGSERKFDIIDMDVCLAGSVEDLYEIKEYADYYLASANSIPGSGTNYIRFMYSMTEGITPEDFGKNLVSNFYTDYKSYNPINLNSEAGDRVQKSNYDVMTLSLFKTEEAALLAENISSLAGILINSGSTKYYDSYTYNNYILNNLIRTYNANFNPENFLYYKGNMNSLLDIGVLMDRIAYYSADTIDGEENDNAWPELNQAAKNVISSLKDTVVCSWRDGLYNQDSKTYGMYSRLDGIQSDDFTGHYYGLTICGSSRRNGGEDFKVYGWYETNLAFGAETSWFKLLNLWFPTVVN